MVLLMVELLLAGGERELVHILNLFRALHAAITVAKQSVFLKCEPCPLARHR